MYDLWYALGTAIMDPSLLTTIQNEITAQGSPAFNRLKCRVFVEVQEDGSTKTISNLKTAGLLDTDVVTAVRGAIRGHIQAGSGAPPVSFYAAGKLSQFLAIGVIHETSPLGPLDFRGIITVANGVFTAEAGPAVSAGFTALLGLCIIDEKARAVIAGNSAEKSPLLDEFGIPGSEQARITSIAAEPRFVQAQKSFLEGERSTWNSGEGCSEQLFNWDGQSERAVF